MNLGYAVAFINACALLQIGLGFVLGVSVWSRIFRARSSATAPSTRELLVTFAASANTISFFIAAIVWFGRGFEFKNSPLVHRAGLAIALTAFALALLAKGRGRIITAISSGILALSWLPLPLP